MSSRSSRTEPGPESRNDLPETVAVGRVLKAHGIQGEVVVEAISDVPGRLDAGSSLLLVREGEPARTVEVAASRPHKGAVLVRFASVDGRDEAEALRGAWLEVPRSRVPAAPEGTYYHFELLGCRCVDCGGGGKDLGEVVELLEDGGGLLLIVSDGERRIPVPFVQAFLRQVDVAGGRIELDLPPGLLETCASRS
ncbi:MAG TPA: ribosome maturation factor RimM [Thermoanaerobaculia bacterium]|nr:ribosome maturation factor RimM [Thermoanaerobaculia bacterium]